MHLCVCPVWHPGNGRSCWCGSFARLRVLSGSCTNCRTSRENVQYKRKTLELSPGLRVKATPLTSQLCNVKALSKCTLYLVPLSPMQIEQSVKQCYCPVVFPRFFHQHEELSCWVISLATGENVLCECRSNGLVGLTNLASSSHCFLCPLPAELHWIPSTQ